LFGELPKLFDRAFVISYLLPSTLWMGATLTLLDLLGLMARIRALVQETTLSGAQAITIGVAAAAVLLLALNRPLIRMLEGYGGPWNPVSWLLPLELRRFDRAQAELDASGTEYAAQGRRSAPPAVQERMRRAMEIAATRFPTRRDLVLPTAFGNSIRAFEDYPAAVYGLGSIRGWPRLLAVVPADFRNMVEDAKSQMALWLNLWFASLVLLAEYIAFCHWRFGGWHASAWRAPWMPIALIAAAAAFSALARGSALQWGETVKAAFDAFIPDLAAKLGFAPPATRQQEKAMWQDFTRAMAFREGRYMDALAETMKSTRRDPAKEPARYRKGSG
jgi:hypothetical protein